MLTGGMIVLFFIVTECKKKEAGQPGNITISYKESQEDFANPERGFYRHTQTEASNFEALNIDDLLKWRTLQEAGSGANYSIYSTLVFRYYVLDIFKTSLLSSVFLDQLKTDFVIARQAGVKLIPRFTYTVTTQSGGCPESFACPPYGDASKVIMLQHIGQLKPLLQENADVIACMQMGFIGIWGENYYSDFFGDPSSNGQGKLLDENWQDRIDILNALLDALPADRMIQVRSPQMKQRYVYGVRGSVNSPALTGNEGFTETDKARIGFHNDCFLSGPDDYGTYEDLGNSASPRQSANTILREYVKNDSKYTAMGGETCDDTYSPQNDCENAGMAQTELRKLHYSYLNSAYNNDVNNDWQNGGCMNDIKKNLGYRLVLQDAVFPSVVNTGTNFNFSINLENKGYASPFNARPLKLIMRKENSIEEFVFDLPDDVSKWYTGAVKINVSVRINSTMTKGRYELFLFLPDKYSSIAKRPEYAIRLANENSWEANTGYNKLMTTVTIR